MGRNTTLSRYRYEIDDQNVIRAWDNEIPNEKDAPFLLQPYNPETGNAWIDKAEAEAWILAEIEVWSQPPLEELIEE
jgi:hypothetical protein